MRFEDIKIDQTFRYTKLWGGKTYTYYARKLGPDSWVTLDNNSEQTRWYEVNRTITWVQPLPQKGIKDMFSTISSDLRGYVAGNKELIYTIILLLLVDQYVFDGAFRDRLKAIIERLVKKTEDRIDTISTTAVKTE